MYFLFIILIQIPWSLACRPEGSWWTPPPDNKSKKPSDQYFPPGEAWGGWTPPKGDDDWKKWIEQWGKDRTTDRPESDEWDSERGPGSGWPQHWRGFGLGIAGVPPPPWAYVPESYDKPQYCFHKPQFGDCNNNVTRWAYEPSKMKCQKFFYSGCGGSDNTFLSNAQCEAACVATAATDCQDDPAVNFEEMMNIQYEPESTTRSGQSPIESHRPLPAFSKT